MTSQNASLNSLLTYLRAIRQPYLSTAPPTRRTATTKPQSPPKGHDPSIPIHLTDPQREDIDRSTSDLLRDLNNSLTALSQAANLQHSTATQLLHKKYGRPTSFLFRWAAGDSTPDTDAGKTAEQIREEGQIRTQKDWREGVLDYLKLKLQAAAGAQSEMVEKRVEREREKGMSRLSDVRNKGIKRRESRSQSLGGPDAHIEGDNAYGNVDLRGRDAYDPSLDLSSPNQLDLPPDQLQLFEAENATLFAHYNDQLAKITAAEKSLLDISSLQQTLLSHLTVQGEQIGTLVENAAQTGEDLKRGNKELKRASERSSTAKAVFWGTAGLCGFLICWDLVF